MGVVSTILGFSGFGFGFSAGIVIGYFIFIYVQPTDVKDVKVRPIVEYDSKSLEAIFPEIPMWVKNPDYDRIDWLNRFVELMWPFLDKAICRTAQDIAKPIIAENTEKYKIDSVEFESLTLGSLPPTFQGMKVYVTEEQELIMEPSVKWAANPNITVVVKAYGLKATIQIVDLQAFASPRITLKPLVPTFPCFAKILVSLMEKPHADFGLKLLGADLMAIPGLYRFVQAIESQRAGAEVYHGAALCSEKSTEVLSELGLPLGLLPLADVEEVGYNSATGFVWLRQKKSLVHTFKQIGRQVSYAAEVTAFVEDRRMKRVTGVKSKELLIWVAISDMFVDKDDPAKITFKTPTGLSRTFPVAAFAKE